MMAVLRCKKIFSCLFTTFVNLTRIPLSDWTSSRFDGRDSICKTCGWIFFIGVYYSLPFGHFSVKFYREENQNRYLLMGWVILLESKIDMAWSEKILLTFIQYVKNRFDIKNYRNWEFQYGEPCLNSPKIELF